MLLYYVYADHTNMINIDLIVISYPALYTQ